MSALHSNHEHGAEQKTAEFFHAIQIYLDRAIYKRFEVLVSCCIMLLQIITLFNTVSTYDGTPFFYLLLMLIVAYFVTDFVNGLVHMFMDNNTHYTSAVGPYVAAFHLHHAKFIYQTRHPLKVYFDESGTKFWLLVSLLCLVILQFTVHMNTLVNTGLVAFGIFSSIAELSHYWCHNATNKNRIVLWLQAHRILLSKVHHKAHHCSDNVQYAFLNGVTDPLINMIARCFYQGYKNHADKHTRAYMQKMQRL
jgi:hypothetical protein